MGEERLAFMLYDMPSFLILTLRAHVTAEALESWKCRGCETMA